MEGDSVWQNCNQFDMSVGQLNWNSFLFEKWPSFRWIVNFSSKPVIRLTKDFHDQARSLLLTNQTEKIKIQVQKYRIDEVYDSKLKAKNWDFLIEEFHHMTENKVTISKPQIIRLNLLSMWK